MTVTSAGAGRVSPPVSLAGSRGVHATVTRAPPPASGAVPVQISTAFGAVRGGSFASALFTAGGSSAVSVAAFARATSAARGAQ